MQRLFSNKKVLCFGEVLWDMPPEGKRIGGAPLNVAYHLHKLGASAALASRIGEDPLGREIRTFVEDIGLHDSLLQTDPDHPTSTVAVEIQPDHENNYTIVEHVAWDYIHYDASLKKLAEQAGYLVYGSLIARHATARRTLYQLLEHPLVKILDVNLRAPYYSKALVHKLLVRADMVKINEAELQVLSKWFSYTGNKEAKMRSIRKDFNTQVIIVTSGAEGASLLHQNAVYHEKSHPVKVADTIGSGDAFLAGFLSGLIRGASPAEALSTGNEMGAFIAQRAGGCPDYDRPCLKNTQNPIR